MEQNNVTPNYGPKCSYLNLGLLDPNDQYRKNIYLKVSVFKLSDFNTETLISIKI